MPRERAGSYEVGYGKPPRHTQFRKGQSGNPRGGRNRPDSLGRSVTRAMGKKLSITENGRRRQVSALEAIVMAQVQKALKGDHRAAKWLVDLKQTLPLPEPTPSAVDQSKGKDFTGVMRRLDVDTLMKIRQAMLDHQREIEGEKEE